MSDYDYLFDPKKANDVYRQDILNMRFSPARLPSPSFNPQFDYDRWKSVESNVSEYLKNNETKVTPFSERFNNSIFGLNFGNWNNGINLANTLFTGVFGEKSEYAGSEGHVSRSLDSAYDTIQNLTGKLGPLGKAGSIGMGAYKLVGNALNKLGGGTDGMTVQDSILGSSFLAPIGAINGFFGSRTDSITKDEEAFAQVGSSFGGTGSLVDDALEKSNKKYGLLSGGARNKANQQINEAKRLLNLMSVIGDYNSDRRLISQSTSAINSNRYGFDMQGGYDLSAIRVGKLGLKISPAQAKKIASKKKIKIPTSDGSYIEVDSLNTELKAGRVPVGKNKKGEDLYLNGDGIAVKKLSFKNGGSIIELTSFIELVSPDDIPEFKEGGSVKPSYKDWLKTVPKDRLSDLYDLEKAYEVLPFDMLESWRKASEELLKKGEAHLRSIYELPDGDYEFLKLGTEEINPEVHFETDTYHSNENGLKETHDLIFNKDKNRYYYIRKQLKFQEGGSINVIPEGALHARKHNMDVEGITQKGIPVVSNNGELQAEIERQEIIFRISVTLKLEELLKKFYSEETSKKEKDELALEAGKLLVHEILHNTQDNTNNLL